MQPGGYGVDPPETPLVLSIPLEIPRNGSTFTSTASAGSLLNTYTPTSIDRSITNQSIITSILYCVTLLPRAPPEVPRCQVKKTLLVPSPFSSCSLYLISSAGAGGPSCRCRPSIPQCQNILHLRLSHYWQRLQSPFLHRHQGKEGSPESLLYSGGACPRKACR